MATQLPEMENEISSTTLKGPDLRFRRTTFFKASLHELTITTSTLTSCILTNSTISSSTIKDCTISNCNIANSTLVDCKLTNCNLQESPFVKSKLSGCQVTTSSLTLRKFPFELRGMIFKDCLKIEGGKSPQLIVALRGDKELYEQALEVYYKVNYLTLPNDNQIEYLERISAKALSRVSMLRVNTPPEYEAIKLLSKKSSVRTALVVKCEHFRSLWTNLTQAGWESITGMNGTQDLALKGIPSMVR
ncbi:hypothetical protein ONS96_000106 [Cadophora gregata f. sp. sojae]|nr:hypothetical protein ONS96_000106 [Cadophora gregata f. sp. sojae]